MFIEDVEQFTISRQYWSYGKGKNTKLLDHNGYKDCIGFFLQASGFDEKDLLGLDEPIDILKNYKWITKLISCCGLTYYQTSTCYEIIATNDIDSLPLSKREDKLIKLFKSINVTLTFMD